MKQKLAVTHDSRIMAIDPGETCGFATNGPEILDRQSFQQKCTHDEFLQILLDFYPDIVVIEQFDYTHRDKANLVAVEFIGLAKWFVERRKLPIVLQTKSYGKGYFTNEKLKKLGIYKTNHVHAMDATRHLLQFQMANNLFDLRLLK